MGFALAAMLPWLLHCFGGCLRRYGNAFKRTLDERRHCPVLPVSSDPEASSQLFIINCITSDGSSSEEAPALHHTAVFGLHSALSNTDCVYLKINSALGRVKILERICLWTMFPGFPSSP